jgi:ATPase subunit of ABC transporter with duplicated ATPase domains
MALLSLNDVSVTFAGPALLDAVSLAIEDGERLGCWAGTVPASRRC